MSSGKGCFVIKAQNYANHSSLSLSLSLSASHTYSIGHIYETLKWGEYLLHKEAALQGLESML